MAHIPAAAPQFLGACVILPVAIPRHVYATLQALASADTDVSLDWLAAFALREFARAYAERTTTTEAEVHHG